MPTQRKTSTRTTRTTRSTAKRKPRAAAAAPRNLWRAGVDAANAVRAQGGQAVAVLGTEAVKLRRKAGREFDVLRGNADVLLDNARREARNARAAAARQVETYAKPVRREVTRLAKRLEVRFSEQVGAMFGRLGIPSKHEVTELSARVDQLSRQLKARARRAAN